MSVVSTRVRAASRSPSLENRAKADVLDVRKPGFEGVECLSLEQVGDDHEVAPTTQVVSEPLDAGRQALGVVQRHDVGQRCSFVSGPGPGGYSAGLPGSTTYPKAHPPPSRGSSLKCGAIR